MVVNDIERAVFELVEQYNGRSLFTFERFKLTHETDLNEDFRMDPIDAYELLEKYVERFNIEPTDIKFEQYFPEDFRKPHDPLTIQLLIDSAKAGYWKG